MLKWRDIYVYLQLPFKDTIKKQKVIYNLGQVILTIKT